MNLNISFNPLSFGILLDGVEGGKEKGGPSPSTARGPHLDRAPCEPPHQGLPPTISEQGALYQPFRSGSRNHCPKMQLLNSLNQILFAACHQVIGSLKKSLYPFNTRFHEILSSLHSLLRTKSFLIVNILF